MYLHSCCIKMIELFYSDIFVTQCIKICKLWSTKENHLLKSEMFWPQLQKMASVCFLLPLNEKHKHKIKKNQHKTSVSPRNHSLSILHNFVVHYVISSYITHKCNNSFTILDTRVVL